MLNHRRATLLICALFSLLTAWLRFPEPQVSDDAATLATVGSLVDRHTLAIPHMQWLNERVGIGRSGPYGQLYSKYGLGLVLVMSPLYAAGQHFFGGDQPAVWAGYPLAQSARGVLWATCANAILAGLLLFAVDRAIAALWPDAPAHGHFPLLVLGLATPVFLAARGSGSEIGTGLFLTLAALAAARKHFVWSAICITLAALFRPVALPAAVGLAYIVWRQPPLVWVKCALALLAGAAALLLFNVVRFGSPWVSGYADESRFALGLDGLLGLLFSPGRSLALFAGAVLSALPAVRWALRHGESAPARAILGVALGACGFMIVNMFWREWHAGWAYGPRLLIPAMPLLIAIGAPWLRRRAMLPFILLGTVIQIATLAQDPIKVLGAYVNSDARFLESLYSLTRNTIALQLSYVIDTRAVPTLLAMATAIAALLLARVAQPQNT